MWIQLKIQLLPWGLCSGLLRGSFVRWEISLLENKKRLRGNDKFFNYLYIYIFLITKDFYFNKNLVHSRKKEEESFSFKKWDKINLIKANWILSLDLKIRTYLLREVNGKICKLHMNILLATRIRFRSYKCSSFLRMILISQKIFSLGCFLWHKILVRCWG